MADGDGINALNDSLRTIAIYRSDLTQQIEKYNKFHVDLTGIPTFDGTGESTWNFIQQIKVIARARNWPTGEIGASTIIPAEGIYGEVLAAATNLQTPFGTNI